MLKIQDSTGKVIAVLKDEDSSPEMKVKSKDNPSDNKEEKETIECQ